MTAGIAVEALSLTLGAFRLDGIDFAASRGEILVILGPNGAGKSVTLETIAGFHRPDSGRVRIAGRDVTALPPERRKIGFVVQNFGLFPHLDVEANVAIARRHDKGGPRTSALPLPGDPAALLGHFGVAHLARRLPADLSPGEKQRVALARAVAGAPDLFLFDEPFAALDQTRAELRNELRSFLRELSIPAIFVTHDHIEARTLADQIVVLRGGAMLQNGSAADVFQRPASSAVARFIGVENILDGRIAEIGGGIAVITVGAQTLHAAATAAPAAPGGVGTALRLCIRAEDVAILPFAEARTSTSERNRLNGKIVGLRCLGALVCIEIDAGFPLKSYLLGPQARAMNLGVGDRVVAEIAEHAIHLMAD